MLASAHSPGSAGAAIVFAAIAGVGALLLVGRRRHQAFWASIFGEKQAGFAAPVRYVLGPVFLIVCGLVGLAMDLIRLFR
jgi:hypothetical protein